MITDKMRQKHLKAAQKLLPGANLTGYAVGRSGMNPVIVVILMVATFVAVCGGLLVATGTFVIPGVIPVLLVQFFASPPRSLVVADQGIALTKRSFWTGKPHDLVAQMGHGYVQPVESSMGRVKLMVGNEAVWVSANEEKILRAALQQAGPPPVA